MPKKAPMPKINPDLRDFLPTLPGDALARLLHMIKTEGPRVAVCVAEDGDLVDGYNRFEIYKSEKIGAFPIRVIEGLDTLAKKKRWMINHQFGRRNLNKEQRDALVRQEMMLRAELEAEEAAKPKDSKAKENLSQSETNSNAGKKDTLAEVAALAGVSRATAGRAVAAAKNFCERCARIGNPVKDCPKCAEKAAEAKSADKAKGKGTTRKKKKGDALVDWKKLEAAVGVCVRHEDVIRNGYPDAKDTKLLNDYAAATEELVRAHQALKKKYAK